MNVVDSSGWIEYFNGGPNTRFFSRAIEAVDELVVPTASLLEVYRHLLRHQGPDDALRAVAGMQQGHVADLDRALALQAAEIGVEHELPSSGSVILATARAYDAVLWTQDTDFEGLDGVLFARSRPRSGTGVVVPPEVPPEVTPEVSPRVLEVFTDFV